MTRDELQQFRDWADGKIATGAEPPWAWFQYMKLRETLDAILAGMAVATTENSQQSEEQLGKRLRLVDETYQQDTVPLRPSDEPVQMPM